METRLGDKKERNGDPGGSFLTRYALRKSSKSDAAISHIPSGVNVLEENITKNPIFYVMSPSESSMGNVAAANLPPVRLELELTPMTQVLEPAETCPRLNKLGEIANAVPAMETEMGVLKSQGTEIQKSGYAAADRQNWTTYWCRGHHQHPVLMWHQYSRRTSERGRGRRLSGWHPCRR